MTVVKFKAAPDLAAEAEAWCRICICEGYYKTKVADDLYRFTFLCPFEAQRFIDQHHFFAAHERN